MAHSQERLAFYPQTSLANAFIEKLIVLLHPETPVGPRDSSFYAILSCSLQNDYKPVLEDKRACKYRANWCNIQIKY